MTVTHMVTIIVIISINIFTNGIHTQYYSSTILIRVLAASEERYKIATQINIMTRSFGILVFKMLITRYLR